MKTAVLLLLLVPGWVSAQDIVLVDRNLKRPMSLTRTLTPRQLMGNVFPIYRADLDSVIQVTESLTSFINTGVVHEANMQLLTVGHSQFAVTTRRTGTFNSYIIYLNTRSGNIGTSLELVGREDNNRQALQQLLLFMDYLKNNRNIVAEKDSR